jgi:hypothetical protein
MPVKVMMMLKRKPGMTQKEFCHAYETGHSRLGLKLFGHLWLEYRRHYVNNANNFLGEGGIPDEGGGEGKHPCDAISEMVFPDMAAVEESNRIATLPENRRLLTEDEDRMFDRANCWITIVEMMTDDPRAAHAELNRS